jgi:hypothetical protein
MLKVCNKYNNEITRANFNEIISIDRLIQKEHVMFCNFIDCKSFEYDMVNSKKQLTDSLG